MKSIETGINKRNKDIKMILKEHLDKIEDLEKRLIVMEKSNVVMADTLGVIVDILDIKFKKAYKNPYDRKDCGEVTCGCE